MSACASRRRMPTWSKGEKLMRPGRHQRRADRVYARPRDRSQQRTGPPGYPEGQGQACFTKPNQETSIPENKTEELTEVGSPGTAQAHLQRATHLAHDGRQQGGLLDRGQSRRDQRAVRSRVHLQAHPSGYCQRILIGCLAHRGYSLGHVLAPGHRQHHICCR